MSPWNVLLDWPPNWAGWRASVSGWFKRVSSWILIGLLAQLAGITWISRSGISSDVDLCRGFNKPVIAFELAKNPAEANLILAGGKNKGPMQTQFYRDFRFIASYMLTFILLGCALFAKDKTLSRANIAAVGLIVLALLAGSMDVLENLHGLAALQQQPLPAGELAKMRFVSRIKWSALGAICIPAAYAFWPAQGFTLFRIISKLASSLLMLAAGIFAVGEFSPDLEHVWEFSFLCMAASGAFQVLILILWADEFEHSIAKKRYPERFPASPNQAEYSWRPRCARRSTG